jgi:hypothetical protein
MSPELRKANGRKVSATTMAKTPEERSERVSRGWANMTPKQREARVRKTAIATAAALAAIPREKWSAIRRNAAATQAGMSLAEMLERDKQIVEYARSNGTKSTRDSFKISVMTILKICKLAGVTPLCRRGHGKRTRRA